MRYFNLTVSKPEDTDCMLSIGLAHPDMTDEQFFDIFLTTLDMARVISSNGNPEVEPDSIKDYTWTAEYMVENMGFSFWDGEPPLGE